jgi:hypothetical protein
MNEQNSEQESEILPPPLPSANNPEHQIMRKIRAQGLNLSGQSALVASLLIHLKNQLLELNTLSQGYLDSMTMVRIVFEENQFLIYTQGWLYLFPAALIIKYLRELDKITVN